MSEVVDSAAAAPKIAHEGAYIDINLIQIARDTRQRREIKPADLAASIIRRGLLHPPVIRRGDYMLMSGERRLEACRSLGWSRIPVRFLDSLDPIEGELVELEENLRREQLPWQDEVRAVARITKLKQAQDPDVTQSTIADEVGITKGHLSLYLRVAENLDEEKISSAPGVREAYNILNRRDQRAQGDALLSLLSLETNPNTPTTDEGLSDGTTEDSRHPRHPRSPSEELPNSNLSPSNTPAQTSVAPVHRPPLVPPSPRSEIICADFFSWLQQPAPEQKFNLIHCDFPYGINVFAGKQGQGAEPGAGYSDDPELYFRLLTAFCTYLDRFMSLSGHLVFWFSAKHRVKTMELFSRLAPSLEFYPYDLVWHKSDNAGIAGDQRRHPRHTYESALMASRSSRHILQVVADSYAGPTDKRLHPSAKPEPMLRHFFRMFVDANTRVFDPTAGSGAALRAAESLGAKTCLGLELDPENATVAQRELVRARQLRGASAMIGAQL